MATTSNTWMKLLIVLARHHSQQPQHNQNHRNRFQHRRSFGLGPGVAAGSPFTSFTSAMSGASSIRAPSVQGERHHQRGAATSSAIR